MLVVTLHPLVARSLGPALREEQKIKFLVSVIVGFFEFLGARGVCAAAGKRGIRWACG